MQLSPPPPPIFLHQVPDKNYTYSTEVHFYRDALIRPSLTEVVAHEGIRLQWVACGTHVTIPIIPY